jgi:acetoin:2,6-dichlorophenolindophenol oxidoreductase subunit beta
MTTMRYLEAITAVMRQEMRRDERVFVMGEDVVASLLGSTAGFFEEFGADRVRDTPLAEAGFVGAGAGAAMVGMRPVVELGAVFFYVAFDQLVSIIAKSTYLYGGQASIPLTLRATMMYGGSMAAQHSDRPISTMMTIPGIKLIAPSSPYDVKGLLATAIRDDDPVFCFEDSNLWGVAGEVPDEDYLIPIGLGDVKREGSDVSIVAVAGAVPAALGAADALAGEGISAEVVDPRTVVPLDAATILSSVEKTGHLVVADPCPEMGSVASEIAAMVAERGFWHLQAPIARVTAPHCHVPFSPPLEAGFYPTVERITEAVHKTLS